MAGRPGLGGHWQPLVTRGGLPPFRVPTVVQGEGPASGGTSITLVAASGVVAFPASDYVCQFEEESTTVGGSGSGANGSVALGAPYALYTVETERNWTDRAARLMTGSHQVSAGAHLFWTDQHWTDRAARLRPEVLTDRAVGLFI